MATSGNVTKLLGILLSAVAVGIVTVLLVKNRQTDQGEAKAMAPAAAQFRLVTPKPPNEQEVLEMRRRLSDLLVTEGASPQECIDLLLKMGPGLPQVTSGWTKLTMGGDEPALAAVRFTCPTLPGLQNEGLDVFWAYFAPKAGIERGLLHADAPDPLQLEPKHFIDRPHPLQPDGSSLLTVSATLHGQVRNGSELILWMRSSLPNQIEVPLIIGARETFHAMPQDVNIGYYFAKFAGVNLADHSQAKNCLQLTDHGDEFCNMKFSGDSKRVVALAESGRLQVWDAHTGKEVMSMTIPRKPGQLSELPVVLAINHSGKIVACALSGSEETLLFDVDSGQQVGSISIPPTAEGASYRNAAFESKGPRLALAFDYVDGMYSTGVAGVDLYDTAAEKRIGVYVDPGLRPTWVSWVPEKNELLVSGGIQVYSISAKTLETVSKFNTKDILGYSDGTHSYRSPYLYPDGKRMLSYDYAGVLTRWDIASGEPQLQTGTDTTIRSLSLSSNGELAAYATTHDSQIRILDTESFRLRKSFVAHDFPSTLASFSADGTLLATASIGGAVRLWSTEGLNIPERTSFRDDYTNSIGMQFAWVPPGSFEMGSRLVSGRYLPLLEREVPRRTVILSRGLFVSRAETTVAQFKAFVDETGYVSDAEKAGKGLHAIGPNVQPVQVEGLSWKNLPFTQLDTHPAVAVSWNDAVAFCNWLSSKEGRTCRLPTEAEWEYSCLSGGDMDFFNGHGPLVLWYSGNIADLTFSLDGGGEAAVNHEDRWGMTSPVRSFLPNHFGLFDMHGNASELCSDWFESGYPTMQETDPTGPTSGKVRCRRGGSFADSPIFARSSARTSVSQDAAFDTIGFRIVVEPN